MSCVRRQLIALEGRFALPEDVFDGDDEISAKRRVHAGYSRHSCAVLGTERSASLGHPSPCLQVYISSASVWEIGIKRTIGKLDIPNEFFEIAVDAGCRPLPISRAHRAAATPHRPFATGRAGPLRGGASCHSGLVDLV